MSVAERLLSVPFHRAAVGEEEAQAVADVVRSGWLTMGPRTIEFERAFAGYIGTKHAIAVCSGTAALHLGLEALRLSPGDEVIVPTTTFTATAEVVIYLGARPVLADVDAATLNVDPQDVQRRITRRTRAIIPVHFAGQPCDLDELAYLAARHDLQILEDAAHALPASYHGLRIGRVSRLTAFSFYATKTLTTGEGGMITTDDDAISDRLRIMRLHGIGRDAWKRYSAEGSWFYEVLEAGYKYNLTDLNAALGLVQLEKADAMCAARAAIACRYSQAFQALPQLQAAEVRPDRVSAWHLYVLRLRLDTLRIGRDQFIEELKQRGVGTNVHFIPLHLQPYYQRTFHYRRGDLPNAEEQYWRSISLPIFPGMSAEEIDYVIDCVTAVVHEYAR